MIIMRRKKKMELFSESYDKNDPKAKMTPLQFRKFIDAINLGNKDLHVLYPEECQNDDADSIQRML